jgi:hypothetical protein
MAHWNIYTLTTLHTYNTYNTLTTLIPINPTLKEEPVINPVIEEWELKMFEKITKAGINARALELYSFFIPNSLLKLNGDLLKN